MESSTVSIHSEDFSKLIDGLKVSHFMRMKQIPIVEDDLEKITVDTAISEIRSCSFCKIKFDDQAHQRQHYKLDWHRYNLKLNLKQRRPITEENFISMADADGVSSISGSESGTENDPEMCNVTEVEDEEALSHLIARRMRIIFQNGNGNILSFYRCWFTGKKDHIPSEPELISVAQKLPTSSQVMVLLVGGGHFAASIFKGTEVILHKTFHNYTGRTKPGGAQGAKDSKRASGSKSVGTGPQKYNEKSLTQNVQELLTSWTKEVANCDLIFMRAVGPINRSVLFNGKQSALDKNDVRLRTIPVPTRRPTFHETQRVFNLLTSITVYECKEIFCSKFLCSSPRKDFETKNKESDVEKGKRKTYDRSKSRTSPQRPLPDIVARLAIELDCSENEEYSTEYYETSFSESLCEFEVFIPSLKQNDARKKKKNTKPNKESKPGKPVLTLRKNVYAACINGDVNTLENILKEKEDMFTVKDIESSMNQCTQDGLTLLQFAAKNSFKDIVRFILLNGGDVCARNAKCMTAYDFAPDEETQNIFRRFMNDYPDRYDYTKSHIPNTPSGEAVESGKLPKKTKRLKERNSCRALLSSGNEKCP